MFSPWKMNVLKIGKTKSETEYNGDYGSSVVHPNNPVMSQMHKYIWIMWKKLYRSWTENRPEITLK